MAERKEHHVEGEPTLAERLEHEQNDVEAVLLQARAFIEHGWCQNSPAESELGVPVYFTSPKAARFCVTGALSRVTYPTADGSLYNRAGELLVEAGGLELARWISSRSRAVLFALTRWNDNPARRKEEVLALYSKAARLARRRA